MNPFMGGFHYLNDERNNPQLQSVNENFLKIKKKVLFC
jgi:hypothetical protein